MQIGNYKIQDWLFNEAEGHFEIDLAESGIQYHTTKDLDLSQIHHLNYSVDRGDLGLRETIARLYGVGQENVVVTNGGQEALYLLYRSLLQSGDHMITFSPGWQQSWEVPRTMGVDVDVLDLSQSNYRLDVALLEQHLRATTKLVVLNSPHNPTGSNISDEDMAQIIALCEKKGIFVLNDEEYLTDCSKSIAKRSKFSGCVSSLSKIYGFPGLRTGWFVGPKDVVEGMVNYKRYTTVCNAHLCEVLATQVLGNVEKYIAHYKSLVSKGLLILRTWIQRHPGLTLIEPQDTPFAYILFNKHRNSQQFARDLLREQRVLIMPAEVLGDKSAFRVSFAREKQLLWQGLDKISSELRVIGE